MELLSDLILPQDPDSPLEAATKQYVDANAGASELGDTWNTAWGVIGSIENIQNNTGIGTTAVQLTGMSLTVPVILGRRYRLNVRFHHYQNTTLGAFAVAFQRDAVSIGQSEGGFTAVGLQTLFESSVIDEPIATGTVTYTVWERAAVGGTINTFNAAGRQAEMTIEDVGPTASTGVTPNVSAVWNTAWGMVAEASVITTQSSISSAVDLTGMSVTFTPVIGRKYKYSVKIDIAATAAGAVPVLQLCDAASVMLDRHTMYMGSTPSETVAWSTRTETFGSTTPVTRKLRLFLGGGTGTLSMQCAVDYPAKLIVEDVGPITPQGVMPTTSALWNMPWGVITQAIVTAPQAGLTGPVDLIGMSVNYTPIVGRQYAYRVKIDVGHSTAGAGVVLFLTDEFGTALDTFRRVPAVAGSRESCAWTTQESQVLETDPKPYTRKLRIYNSGAGTVSTFTAGDYPAKLVVEDLGPVVKGDITIPAQTYVSEWQSWIPTVVYGTGAVTLGDNDSKWRQVGQMIECDMSFRDNGCPGANGPLRITLPVSAHVFDPAMIYTHSIGTGIYFPTNGSVYPFIVTLESPTVIVCRPTQYPASPAALSYNSPIAIVAGDQLHLNFSYRVDTMPFLPGLTSPGFTEWAEFQILGPPSAGATDTIMYMAKSGGTSGVSVNVVGGYATDIVVSRPGPYRITTDISGLIAANAFWIVGMQHSRGGTEIARRDVVSGGAANIWTTASAEHVFNALSGDVFRIYTNAGGVNWTVDGRSWVTVQLLTGQEGPQGIPGPPGVVAGLPTVEAWIAPTLLNGWLTYGVANTVPGYFKDPFGIVHLKGFVKSGTVPSVIFNLPAGYRPQVQEVQVTASNALFGYAQINPTGDVRAQVGSPSWFSLDGMTFRAYQ